MKTNKEEFEELIDKCFFELTLASKEKYDADKAERTAAMFLAAQMQLAFFITDIELRARHSKNDITRVEAQAYFEIKDNAITGKKITEATLTNSVAKNNEVIETKKANCEAEADLKKFNYLMSTLKEGHIFFRNVGKAKGPWNE
jgi:hypothetical protein